MTHDDLESSPRILVERAEAVAVLRLNRPDKRNAIDRGLASELERRLAELAEDDAVRAVVLTGNGPAFCAGADLLDSRPADLQSVLVGRARRITDALDHFPKPVIAAVNGAASGGGCELVLASDLRIASQEATFCLPEVRIGSLPGSGGTQRLVRAVGSAVAAKLLMTGAPIDAAEAHRVGLVSDVYPAEVLLDAAMTLAVQVAANAPLSLLAAKQALALDGDGRGMQLERALWALLATSRDRAEGRLAFRERRSPRFWGE